MFRVPALPPKRSPSESVTPIQTQAAINYEPPHWSSRPPEPTGSNVLDDEGYCSHYFLEVIKSGTVIDKIKLDKEFISFGRLDACDVLCEHPTLSRFHAVLQYSNGEAASKDYPEGFYVYDLSSTHGTFINKTRLEPNKYTRLDLDSMIKFGMSTRMYVLHGPKRLCNADDLNINLTHEQMRLVKEKHDRIALKLRIRKELEEEESLKSERGSASWGMTENEEELENESSFLENKKNPFAVEEQEDESFYASDPRKALKNFFDREGEEPFYDVEELGIGKFKCKIQLPVLDICVETQHDGKKNECMTKCALEACRLLNAEGVLKQSRQDIIKRNKQKELESADFYDSDDDTYLDRTGDVERKRLMRMKQAGKVAEKDLASKNKTHTFDSIKDDIKSVLKEKFEIESKLAKCREVMKAIDEDDVDSYIESLKVGADLDTITRAKMKKRLVEIGSEVKKLEKLLNVSKPAGFDAEKWKSEVVNQMKHLARPVEVEVKKEVLDKPKLRETEKVEIKNDSISSEIKRDEEKLEEPKPIQTKRKEKEDKPAKSDNINKISKKQKIKYEEPELELEEYVDSKDYAVWVPPSGKIINLSYYI